MLLSFLALAATGCRSYWINATVVNRTGETIRELEVDYPTASFGINEVRPGSNLRYRLQIRGSGPVKVEYNRIDGKTIHAEGLILSEHQEGQLQILLMPEGKVQFVPNLNSTH
jgi:hypothetical protein